LEFHHTEIRFWQIYLFILQEGKHIVYTIKSYSVQSSAEGSRY